MIKKYITWFLYPTIAVIIGAQITIARTGPLTSITRFFALPLVFLWMIEKLRTLRFRSPHPLLGLLYLFFGWTLLSVMWAPDSSLAMKYIVTPLPALFIGWVMWENALDDQSTRRILQSVVVAGWLIFAQLTYNALKHQDVYASRAGTFAMDPNSAAFYLALILPLAFYIGLDEKPYNKFVRFSNLIFPGACFVAIVITASRGGLVALGIAAIGTLFLVPVGFSRSDIRRPLTWAFSLAASLSALMILKIDIKAQVARLLSIATSAKTDQFTGRLPVWAATLHLLSHAPILGVGANGNRYFDVNAAIPISVGNIGLQTHNTPLEVITSYGIIGFFIFYFIFYQLGKEALKCNRIVKSTVATFIVTFLIGSLSLSSEENVYLWVIISAYALLVYVRPAPLEESTSENLRKIRMTSKRLVPVKANQYDS